VKLLLSWFLVCAVARVPSAGSDDKPTTRVYTNEDLDRIKEKRGETGVASQAAAAQPAPAPPRSERSHARGESYWRQEAERERRRLAPLQDRMLALERSLREKRAAPTPRSGIRPPTDGLEAQVEALRRRIREQQGRFEDRARREGALPGWLR
jgi:hypothetical protein